MINYLLIREGDTALLIDQENGLVLLARLGKDWAADLAQRIGSVAATLDLPSDFLVLIDCDWHGGNVFNWRLAHLTMQRGKWQPPVWKAATEEEVNWLFWSLDDSRPPAYQAPFPAHLLTRLLKNLKQTPDLLD